MAKKKKTTVKTVDLFAGLGGIRLGFKQAADEMGLNAECVFSSEIKPYAIEVYKRYFGDKEMYGDITKVNVNIDIPDFDVLFSGFPCQPFSSAGGRKGFADTRGTLFFEIERILKEKMNEGRAVKAFLLENVEGLTNHDGGRTLSVIIQHLEELGYKTTYKLIDSKDFGLPQSRKRVYIVGTLNEHISLDDFPVTTAKLGDILEHGLPTVDSRLTRLLLKNYTADELKGKAIKDKRGGDDNIHSWDIGLKGRTTKKERDLLNLLLKERRKKQWAAEIGITWMDGMPLTEQQIRTFFDVPNLNELLNGLVKKGYLTYEHPKEQIKNEAGALVRVEDTTKPKGYNIVAGKLSFEFSKILDPEQLAPTLVAMDVSKLGVIDGDGIRRLTIKECQRLCGYPDDYDLGGISEKEAYDLLGNTVCVPVIREISKRICEYLIK